MSWPALAAGAVLAAVLAGYPLALAVGAARVGRRGGLPDRAGAVAAATAAVVAVVVARVVVPWHVLPPLLWALPVAATTFGVLAAALAWRSLPAVAGPRPRRRLASTSLSTGVGLVLLAAVVAW